MSRRAAGPDRHRDEEPDDPPLRRSLRLKTVAAALDCDPSTVRKLLKDGLLQGHRVGRGVRVYLDSVEAYRAGHRLDGPPARPAPAPGPAHRQAVAELRRLGIL